MKNVTRTNKNPDTYKKIETKDETFYLTSEEIALVNKRQKLVIILRSNFNDPNKNDISDKLIENLKQYKFTMLDTHPKILNILKNRIRKNPSDFNNPNFNFYSSEQYISAMAEYINSIKNNSLEKQMFEEWLIDLFIFAAKREAVSDFQILFQILENSGEKFKYIDESKYSETTFSEKSIVSVQYKTKSIWIATTGDNKRLRKSISLLEQKGYLINFAVVSKSQLRKSIDFAKADGIEDTKFQDEIYEHLMKSNFRSLFRVGSVRN